MNTPQMTDAIPELLRALPAVSEVDLRGDRTAISSTQSDHTLRALLASFPNARDIEVTAIGLEDAFLTLTDDLEGADPR